MKKVDMTDMAAILDPQTLEMARQITELERYKRAFEAVAENGWEVLRGATSAWHVYYAQRRLNSAATPLEAVEAAIAAKENE